MEVRAAAIGVGIEWHGYGSCPRGRLETIRISLTVGTPEDYLPGAFAYAEPFERAYVRVFYDRVLDAGDSGAVPAPLLLAHVLAHEITHILEGASQHSASGVMKARWGRDEYFKMAKSPLAFTEEDVAAIHRALASRASAAQQRVGTVH